VEGDRPALCQFVAREVPADAAQSCTGFPLIAKGKVRGGLPSRLLLDTQRLLDRLADFRWISDDPNPCLFQRGHFFGCRAFASGDNRLGTPHAAPQNKKPKWQKWGRIYFQEMKKGSEPFFLIVRSTHFPHPPFN